MGLGGLGYWTCSVRILAERARCGEGGCRGLMVGDGAVAEVRGEWLPCLLVSPPPPPPPIRDDIDIDAPGLEPKLGRSRPLA